MKYLRLLSRLYGTPLAIAESKLDILTSNVTLKLLASDTLDSDYEVQEREKQEDKGYGIVSIFDSLVSKNGAGSSGSTSYQSIVNQSENLIAQGHTKIIYYIDSPGGEVAGLFSTAAYIQNLKARGIDTVGFTDGTMASAAYVLGSATDKLYSAETSIVGSIGVLMTLVNTVKGDKKEGREYKILRSKGEKAKLNPHEPFDEKALTKAESMLSTLDGVMNDTILSYRQGLTLETILDLNGNVVLGKEALSIGLVDGLVGSLQELLTMEGTPPKKDIPKIANNIGANMTLEEAQAAIIELKGEVDTLKAKVSTVASSSIQEERTRVVGILNAATTLKLSQAVAIKRINAGTSVEDTVSMFEDIAETLASATDIPVGASEDTQNPSMVESPSDFHSLLGSVLDADAGQGTLFGGIK